MYIGEFSVKAEQAWYLGKVREREAYPGFRKKAHGHGGHVGPLARKMHASLEVTRMCLV